MKYRYTNVPSLLQGDIPDGEEVCYITGIKRHCDFHHVMNGAFKKKSEKYGCWVWLTPHQHYLLHNTKDGKRLMKELKTECQKEFEKRYSHEEWMHEFKKNYLHD